MNTRMSATSLAAYDAIPDLNERQRQVRDAIATLRHATNQQIADLLRWPINQVTPRTLELREAGVVALHGIVRQKNNRPAKVWTLVGRQQEMFA